MERDKTNLPGLLLDTETIFINKRSLQNFLQNSIALLAHLPPQEPLIRDAKLIRKHHTARFQVQKLSLSVFINQFSNAASSVFRKIHQILSLNFSILTRYISANHSPTLVQLVTLFFKVVLEFARIQHSSLISMLPIELLSQLESLKDQLSKFSFILSMVLEFQKILSDLVKFNLIYKQLQKHISANPQSSDQALLEVLQGVKQRISKLQLSDLISSYTNQQNSAIHNIKQICRICQTMVQVQHLDNHLELCQKTVLQKNRLKEVNNKFNDMIRNVGDRIIQLRAYNYKARSALSISLTDEPTGFMSLKRLDLGQNINVQEQLGIMQQLKFKMEKISKKFYEIENEINGDIGAIMQLIQKYKQTFSNWPEILQLQNLILERLKIQSKIRQFSLKQKHKVKQTMGDLQLNRKSSYQNMCNQVRAIQKNKNLKTVKASIFNTKRDFQAEKEADGETSQNKQQSNKQFLKKKKSIFKNFRSQIYEETYDTIDVKVNVEPRSYYSEGQYMHREQEPLDITHFELVRKLGAGAYGSVFLVRRKLTGDQYAIKLVQRSTKNKIDNLRTEHRVFEVINGDFIVKAPYSFQVNQQYHAFVMQYMRGGDFGDLLEHEVYFPLNDSVFYIAEIVLAIQYLHQLNIIHRDLKPQNIVLQDDGHLKLTDFGLSDLGLKIKTQETCKEQGKNSGEIASMASFVTNKKKKYSNNKIKHFSRRDSIQRRLSIDKRLDQSHSKKVRVIGTPDYIAPQVLKGEQTTKNVDWWALGVMSYQILLGQLPFSAQSINEVYDNILNQELQWPQVGEEDGMIAPEAKDFIQRLLQRDPLKRLGNKGAVEVKSHPLFKNVNWTTIRKEQAPFRPHLQAQEECQSEFEGIPESVRKLFELKKLRREKQQSMHMIRLDILRQQTVNKSENPKFTIQQMRSKVENLQKFSEKLRCQ